MRITRKNVTKCVVGGLFAGAVIFMITDLGAGLLGLAVLVIGLAFLLNDGWLE